MLPLHSRCSTIPAKFKVVLKELVTLVALVALVALIMGDDVGAELD